MNHRWFQSFLICQVDNLTQANGGLFLQLGGSVQNTFTEDGQDGLDALGQAETWQKEVGSRGSLVVVFQFHDGETNSLTNIRNVSHLVVKKEEMGCQTPS